MIVIYAEKPDMARRIASAMSSRPIKKPHHYEVTYNGSEYAVTYGFGHLCELYDVKDYTENHKWSLDNYPFFPEQFKLKLKSGATPQLTKNLKEQYNAVKELFNSSEYIINATDADREGELIFAYIYEYAKCKKPWKRLWLNSVENNAIRTALGKLKSSDEMMPLQNAGRCRSYADYLVGINTTVLSTLSFGGYKNIMSTGRVQTPTLNFFVRRELEIRNFVSKPFWNLKGLFTTEQGETYEGALKNPERFTDIIEAEQTLDKLREYAQLHPETVRITKCDKKPESKSPPLLYDLNALQMQANADFGFSAQKTLDIAQKLYEMQYLTYPRTTSRYLPLDMKPEVKNIIRSLDGEYKVWCDKIIQNGWDVTKPYFDDSKVESHFAIIPTVKNPVDLSDDEQKIYDLVAKSIIRAFYPNAIFNATTIHTEIEGHPFVTKGSSLEQAGWMEVGHKIKEDTLVPNVPLGDVVRCAELKLHEGKTKPPERYTDKTILAAMETAGKEVDSEELRLLMKDSGLGTPATRAGIIEKLIRTGYIERNKKLLIPTEKGMYLIENLPCEELKSPEMTGVWEKRIYDVERGKDTMENFIGDIVKQTKKLCAQIVQKSDEVTAKPFQNQDTNFGQCPLCDGHVVKTKWGYGCSNYNTTKCGFSISGTICGKKLTETNIRNLLSKGTTGKISGFKSKAGNNFSATLKLIDGKTQFEF